MRLASLPGQADATPVIVAPEPPPAQGDQPLPAATVISVTVAEAAAISAIGMLSPPAKRPKLGPVVVVSKEPKIGEPAVPAPGPDALAASVSEPTK